MERRVPSTVNVRHSAVPNIRENRNDNFHFRQIRSHRLRDLGSRLWKWLTREQAKELLAIPDRSTLKGSGNMDPGAAGRLRASPAGISHLEVVTIQLREDRWVLPGN
jgi:hypothetical protein